MQHYLYNNRAKNKSFRIQNHRFVPCDHPFVPKKIFKKKKKIHNIKNKETKKNPEKTFLYQYLSRKRHIVPNIKILYCIHCTLFLFLISFFSRLKYWFFVAKPIYVAQKQPFSRLKFFFSGLKIVLSFFLFFSFLVLSFFLSFFFLSFFLSFFFSCLISLFFCPFFSLFFSFFFSVFLFFFISFFFLFSLSFFFSLSLFFSRSFFFSTGVPRPASVAHFCLHAHRFFELI